MISAHRQTRSMMVAVPMPPPMHKRDERGALAGALEFVERGAEDHRAGRAERMAHGDRAAVDVDLARIDVERLQEAQHDGGEGFVDLEEIDVGDRHARAGEHLLRHVDRAGQHDRRLGADIGEGADVSRAA